MKNDRFLQFDSLIDAFNEDSLEAEDIRELSPEERQMFLVAKNLKGIASYDPVHAEVFKKRLSETLLAIPAVNLSLIDRLAQNNLHPEAYLQLLSPLFPV